jgi:hypothetical protein
MHPFKDVLKPVAAVLPDRLGCPANIPFSEPLDDTIVLLTHSEQLIFGQVVQRTPLIVAVLKVLQQRGQLAVPGGPVKQAVKLGVEFNHPFNVSLIESLTELSLTCLQLVYFFIRRSPDCQTDGLNFQRLADFIRLLDVLGCVIGDHYAPGA